LDRRRQRRKRKAANKEILGAKYQLYQIIVQGLVLVLTIIFMPWGLSGMFWSFYEWVRERRTKRRQLLKEVKV